MQSLGQGYVEGEEGRREDGRSDPPPPLSCIGGARITGLLGFWGANKAPCAGRTFARVRGTVSVLAKRMLSLSPCNELLAVESLWVSPSSWQH